MTHVIKLCILFHASLGFAEKTKRRIRRAIKFAAALGSNLQGAAVVIPVAIRFCTNRALCDVVLSLRPCRHIRLRPKHLNLARAYRKACTGCFLRFLRKDMAKFPSCRRKPLPLSYLYVAQTMWAKGYYSMGVQTKINQQLRYEQ